MLNWKDTFRSEIVYLTHYQREKSFELVARNAIQMNTLWKMGATIAAKMTLTRNSRFL